MLSKLLKYDLKNGFKYFIPMSIFVLVYSLLSTLLFNVGEPDTFSGSTLGSVAVILVITAFIIMVIAYSIITQGIIVVNFYKSMVTDTGYLTHTLPVKKSTIIISKVISGMVIILLSYVVLLICLTAFLDVPTNLVKYHDDFQRVFSLMAEEFSTGTIVSSCISFIILMIASSLQSISIFFVSIAFGQLMNRHKVIGSFVAYFVIMFVFQIISTIFSFTTDNFTSLLDNAGPTFLPAFFSLTSVVAIAIAAIMLFITNWIFTKKLNLD